MLVKKTNRCAHFILIFCLTTSVRGQCFTDNDILNETGVEDVVHSLTKGNTEFAINLLRTLNAEQKTNKDSAGIFFSPHSIWSALIVAFMGSQGRTEHEIRSALGLGNADKTAIWTIFKGMEDMNYPHNDLLRIEELPIGGDSSFKSANRIYFQEGMSFKDCMEELLYDEIAFVDFANQAEDARDAINTWIEDKTNKRITDLIPSDAVNSLTKMVIANAVYFKGTWQQQFNPRRTFRRMFTMSNRQDIYCNMMSTQGTFNYAVSEELQCQALELPYSGNQLSMVVLLPRNRFYGVDNLARKLSADLLENLMEDMYPMEIIVSMPKFKLEDNFELSPVLYSMGLRTLFDAGTVDLSGFTGHNEFKVDAVHHKSFIDVNEEGTEAAAATAVITSRMARPAAKPSFIADYPFVYFIKENFSNKILFMGTLQKPTEVFNDNSNGRKKRGQKKS